MLKGIVKGMFAIAAVGVLASAVVHRKVIMACVKGEEMPEPPAWHKHCGIHKDKGEGKSKDKE